MYQLTVYGPFTTTSTFTSRRAARETACHGSYVFDCVAEVMNLETGEVVYRYENGERVDL